MSVLGNVERLDIIDDLEDLGIIYRVLRTDVGEVMVTLTVSGVETSE